ncbi:hypothetical protein BU24DRAFT_470965 [Aaosphaeria arxii CBS 175.79]|uniref:Mitochondrial outer membrane transport complex Sam37/metaxin N-terminal domain-containing protein n=1 Tax=Aaosphaeria arxii CBS 175.79 TaxID=1450172 RepID=A0A6A5YB68_9PLEO|nr:uncharacterized protein BU24DRAFT_470965 [Aaosphaeria arxii CBS 175.79]KAF2022010.1 hypothetical protein BU24DRAFT_470965 [Aaosphaeria arxii CBS 175.79]
MALELHVWGPAFGLPSIDAECIAAVGYLNSTVPREDWRLVANHDTALRKFPLLMDGSSRTAGFASIVLYLRKRTLGSYDLDIDLNQKQHNNKLAFASFLESTATPLIDLSLYVSAENYSAITTSSYTAILPWYLNYTIPPTRRDQARIRTGHLGLSSLDVQLPDNKDDSIGLGNDFESRKRAAGIPGEGRTTQNSILNMGRAKGIGGLLSSPIYAARFKLDALSNELLEPLSELLGNKEYLLGNGKPSSLDCLTFGYLALMLYPSVPQAWLKEAVVTRFPRIHDYVTRLRERLIGNEEVKVSDAWPTTNLPQQRQQPSLPWKIQAQSGLVYTTRSITREILNNFPVLSTIFRPGTIIQDRSMVVRGSSSSLPSALMVNILMGFSAAAITAFFGFAAHHKRSPREGDWLILWAAQRPSTGLGEAGSFLSVFANELPIR